MLTPADIFAFTSVADARIAPDGSALFATFTTRDVATDSRLTELRRTAIGASGPGSWSVVPDTAGVVTARWAPDGSRIAMLRRDSSGAMTLSVTDGSEARVLHTASTPLREVAWSPDGSRLAFQQRIDSRLPEWLNLPEPPAGAAWAPPPRHTDRLAYRHDAVGELPESVFHTFVIPADGSRAAHQVTSGPWHHGMPHHATPGLTFSADGRSLLMAGTQRPDWDLHPSDTDIHAIRIETGAVERLTSLAGHTAHPALSPDGAWLAFTGVIERELSYHHRRLFVMPAQGGTAAEVLPRFDRGIVEIAWCPDSDGLFVTYEDTGTVHLARVTLEGDLTVLARDMSAGAIEMPYAGHGFSAAGNGAIAYVRSDVHVPCE